MGAGYGGVNTGWLSNQYALISATVVDRLDGIAG
jgi:hypothetical protein